jgi:hypothetical protein
MALIALVTALIDVATLPSELTKSTLLVEFILTFISVAVRSINFLTPTAFTMFHPILEIANIVASVLPLVLAESVRLTELVLSSIDIAISEDISSLSMLETILPFTLISVSVFPFMDTIAVSFGRSPLADVGVTKNAFPDSLALLQTSTPFSFVDFSICPCVETLAMGFIAHEFSFIFVSVRVAFHASTVAGIALPLAFINSRFPIDHDSHSRSFTLDQFPSVNCIVVFLNTKVLCLLEHRIVED